MERTGLFWLLVSAVGLATVSGGCRSPYYADRGAAVGGVAGALTGAAIGDRSGNAAAGAIVGTAIGALTGAAIGDQIDEDLARSRAEVQQRLGRTINGAVTKQDVIAMVQSGVGEDVILTHLRANGVADRLDTRDVIELSRQGVSEAVIIAMQRAPGAMQGAPGPAPQVAYPPPVVVEEHYYVPPPAPVWPYRYCAPPAHHHYHWGPRPVRSGVRLGVSFR